jgi:tripartite-type tricarboxylate transporter receptor subunit TctC
MFMQTKILMAALAVVLGMQFGAATAQNYPTKPIHLLIAYPAGGPTDLAGRYVGRAIEERLGQPVIVENRAGNSGIIGLEAVAQAAPDGHTLAFGGSAISTYPVLIKDYTANLTERLVPVTLAATTPVAIFAPGSLQGDRSQDFIAYAKANPRKVNYGTAGINWTMLVYQKLDQKYGLQMVHIPYKGSSDAQTALLRNDIHLFIGGVIPFIPLMRDGKVKMLAILAKERSPMFPNVQSIAEAGLEEFREVEPAWFGVLAPAGTPAPIVSRLAQTIAARLQTAEVRDQFAKAGLTAVGSTPQELAQQISIDTRQWAQIAKDVNFRPQ